MSVTLASEHDPKQTLYLIDISSFIFRAFYAIRPLTSRQGEPTNAIYGVASMLQKLFDEAQPEYLVVAYDSKEPSFRKERYAEYKANRSAPPEDLVPQFARIDELISLMGVHSFRMSGVEADDLIGTLARRWFELSDRHEVIIVSGDKDLMQLVNGRVKMLDTLKNVLYDATAVEEKMGVGPSQVRDYLALVGDSSDNIPGVSGIGPKGAAELLRKYGDLEAVLQAASAGQITGKKSETLVAQAELARLSQELATVRTDLELRVSEQDFRFRFEPSAECLQFLKSLDFHSLVEKWQARRGGGTRDGLTHGPRHELNQDPRHELNHDPKADPNSTPRVSSSVPASSVEGQVDSVTPQGAWGDPRLLVSAEFRTVLTEEQLEQVVQEIEAVREFGFDLETTSLNPREAEIVGVALCTAETHSWYIPVGHRGTAVEQLSCSKVLERLRPYLEDPRFKKVGQNLKYDASVCFEQGIRFDGVGADTMIAAYVLDPEGRHDLKTLAAKYLNYEVLSYEQVCGKGKDQIGFDLVPIDIATRYSAEDAWVAVVLWRRLRELLEHERLMEVFARVDLPLVLVLARMESVGVAIDEAWLQTLSQEFAQDLRRIEGKIATYTVAPINLNSPKQLAHLLFDELKLPVQAKTKTGFSTDAATLEALAPLHEVPQLLLEYREVAKLKNTYVDPLPQLRDRKDHRIHASFNQAVTATGRLSSSEPNLQNIPIRSERGMRIRRAFVPAHGNVLIAADYSQIELRLLAHMSGDVELVRSFRANEDVHRRTASEIYGVTPEQVKDHQRAVAKAINFGLMYGKTPFGLAQELKISRKEASEMIERYFVRYHGVKRFLDGQVALAKEQGFVTTLLGRKRVLHDIRSKNPALRANAERMAMNTPIQGTAADLMKLAMIELDEKLRDGGFGARLMIQVHDEVVLECPQSECKAVEALVVATMEGALPLSVPLVVNSAHGANWMEL
ncbi:MAG: polymerase [Pseudomonadota bacterium]|jgi:DNA polymerase-1